MRFLQVWKLDNDHHNRWKQQTPMKNVSNHLQNYTVSQPEDHHGNIKSQSLTVIIHYHVSIKAWSACQIQLLWVNYKGFWWWWVYNTQDYWVSGLCPSFNIPKSTTFFKLHLYASSGERVGGTYYVKSISKT
jgi:hypothetical protein